MAPKNTEYLEIAYQRAAEKKTHVSFPQLKYPSLRDEGFKDPVQWLVGKAMDDGAEGLWRVHNGIYDLNSFIDKHPGGAEWLELTKGTDITEAFISHHFNPAVEKMLEKYYVRDATTPRNSPFTFKEDGFYMTLKRAVYEELQKLPKEKLSKRVDRIMDGLLFTCLFTAALTCWSKNYYVVMASYLISSLTLAWSMVCSHNYIHKKTNWRMYIFSLGLWSYRDFRVSHALSHHLYPNTLMDLEISAFEPLVFWIPRKDRPFYVYFSSIIELVYFPFGCMVNFLKRFLRNFLMKDFFKNHYRWHDVIGLLLPVWMWLVSGCTLYEALYNWLWINCTSSFIFFVIGSNAAHHHPKTWKDGDEVRTVNPDWGIHELEAVMDRKDINSNIFTVMTFFGDHALHHLFPTLDHAILPKLYPIFFEHVEKFKTNFNLTTQLDIFIGQNKEILRRDFKLLED